MSTQILNLPTAAEFAVAPEWSLPIAAMTTGALDGQALTHLRLWKNEYPTGRVIVLPDSTSWAVSNAGVVSPGAGFVPHATRVGAFLQTTTNTTINSTTAGFVASSSNLYLFAVIETATNDSFATRLPKFVLSDSPTYTNGLLIASGITTNGSSVTSATDERVFLPEFSTEGHTHVAADITDFAPSVLNAIEGVAGAPVADLTALRAVAPADRQDKQLRFVEGVGVNGEIYKFNAEGVGTDDGDGIIEPDTGTGIWFKHASGSGTGESIVKEITQAAHGFDAQAVRFNGTSYVLAQADSAANSAHEGFAFDDGVNDFQLYNSGFVDGLFTGLVAGTLYYLSPTTPGAITSTIPTMPGQVVKEVLRAVSATSAWLISDPGYVIPTPVTISTFALSLLDDTDAAAMRLTLGAAGLGANVFTAAQEIQGNLLLGVSGGGSLTTPGNAPLNLRAGDGTATNTAGIGFITAGSLRMTLNSSGILALAAESALTNTTGNVFTFAHNTTGTPANNFGGRALLSLETSTTQSIAAAAMRWVWDDVTHATRKGKMVLSAYDTAERDGVTITTDGAKASVGVGGTTPTARLHLPAGATAASSAPLKLTSGALMTAAEAGAMEFLTDALYFTKSTGATRMRIPLAPTAPSAYTETNVTTDRTFDANATTIDELADVLGTLISDLRAAAIIG